MSAVATDALARVATVPRLLVASDFDGTLAPLAPKPWLASTDEAARRALTALAALPATEVAVVSARTLDDLATQLGPVPGVRLLGSYGAESSDGPVGLTDAELRRWTRLVVAFERLAMGDEAAWVERKTLGVALHTRGMADSDPLLRRAAEEAGTHDGVHVVRGSEVVEAVVRPVSKGWVVDDLARRARADATVYLGDDHADEAVFTQLARVDLGVKVGDAPTAAAVRVADPAGVAELLTRLAALRRVWVAAFATDRVDGADGAEGARAGRDDRGEELRHAG